MPIINCINYLRLMHSKKGFEMTWQTLLGLGIAIAILAFLIWFALFTGNKGKEVIDLIP